MSVCVRGDGGQYDHGIIVALRPFYHQNNPSMMLNTLQLAKLITMYTKKRYKKETIVLIIPERYIKK